MRFDKYDIKYISQAYAEKYDKYAAVRKLAREYKCSTEDIFKVLKDNKIIGADYVDKKPSKPKKGRWSDEEIDILFAMKQDGATFNEISDALNRDPDCVSAKYYALKKKGIKIVKSEPKPAKNEEPVSEPEENETKQPEEAPAEDGPEMICIETARILIYQQIGLHEYQREYGFLDAQTATYIIDALKLTAKQLEYAKR